MATKTSNKKNTTTSAKSEPSKKAAKAKAPSKAKTSTPAKSVATNNKPATKRKTAAKSGDVTTIKAHVDIGWGNRLFIRGAGGGLQWETGQEMDWSVDGWTWSTQQANGDGIEFKFLINDEIWAEGENIVIASGESYTSTPGF